MADIDARLDFNVAGKHYVDDQCINCGVCNEIAPELFKTEDDEGYAFVAKQPVGDEELELMKESIESCPVESIGDDG
jgi:ferredoxin